MLLHPPAAGGVAEVGERPTAGAWNVPSPLLERHPHAGVAEADDVGAAVAGDDRPGSADAARRASRRRRSRSRRPPTAAAGRCRRRCSSDDPHAGVAEADDVGAAVAGDVGEEPRMPIDAPAAGGDTRSWRPRSCGALKRAVAVVQRRPRRRRRRTRRCPRRRRRSGRPGSGDASRPASRRRRTRESLMTNCGA